MVVCYKNQLRYQKHRFRINEWFASALQYNFLIPKNISLTKIWNRDSQPRQLSLPSHAFTNIPGLQSLLPSQSWCPCKQCREWDVPALVITAAVIPMDQPPQQAAVVNDKGGTISHLPSCWSHSGPSLPASAFQLWAGEQHKGGCCLWALSCSPLPIVSVFPFFLHFFISSMGTTVFTSHWCQQSCHI